MKKKLDRRLAFVLILSYATYMLFGRIVQKMQVSTLLMPLIVTIFMVILYFAITRYANANIARPLTRLSDAVHRFEDGEQQVQFSAGKTEISEIQEIGNCMNQLQDTIDILQAQKNEQQQLLRIESERAEVAATAKQVFLSRMSHDIRTPMNSIIGMTAIAEANIDDRERVKDALSKIDLCSKQLLAMLNDVLDMSMIEAGRVNLAEENFQLAELINQSIEELRSMTSTRHHQLIVDVKKLIHEHVVGQPQRVRMIFENLIGNAVKYTPQGGVIRVTIEELPTEIRYVGKYRFVFEDNGIGMTKEALEHIFEPFERAVDDQRAGSTHGMGLGLPIVKNIVELMNGSIEVESKPEAGSKFTVVICLKLQSHVQGVATRMQKQEVRLEDFCKDPYVDKRALIVEDHELSGEIAAEILGMAGIEVEQVRNGQQAVLRMGEVPEGYFDLVLMDIQMPVMDGYIAARMIRNLKREDVQHLPIVAMTALSSDEDREAAVQAGMDDYVTKPLELDRLKEILMKWI